LLKFLITVRFKEADMFEYIPGVFKLDPNTFEEIEHGENATSQAAMVVAIIALLSGFGSGFGALVSGNNFFTNFLSSFIWVFVGWLLWSVVTYFIGTAFFKGQATVQEMLRVIGFAYAPQCLAIIPCVGWLIGLVWSLAAGFVAVRQGLDLDNMKAFFTIAIGFIIVLIGNAVIAAIFGGITSFFG
jgi:hypothetical protein